MTRAVEYHGQVPRCRANSALGGSWKVRGSRGPELAQAAIDSNSTRRLQEVGIATRQRATMHKMAILTASSLCQLPPPAAHSSYPAANCTRPPTPRLSAVVLGDTRALLATWATYYINPALGSLHLGFPASCKCTLLQIPKSQLAAYTRPSLDSVPTLSVHALHPSIYHFALPRCRRDRSQPIWLRRTPTRQLSP